MATITYTVTVASGTNAFSASNPKFFINGDVSPVLYLQEGNTYIFDQADSTCTGYLIAFSTTTNGTFTTGGLNILLELPKQEHRAVRELKLQLLWLRLER